MNEIFPKKCSYCDCQELIKSSDNYVDKTDLNNPHSYLKDGILVRKEYHKTCWAEIEKNDKENKEKQEQKQKEICAKYANLSEEVKEEMAEEEEYKKETFDNDDTITWEEYKKTLDKANLTTLETPKIAHKKESFEWETSRIIFPDNKISITKEEFPNLKTLYACGLGLRSVELDHDGLENLYLIDNFLHNINLSKVSNLVNLSLSSNLIDEIVGLEKLTKLEDFRVNGNSLDSLDVRGLINLWCLDCSDNEMTELLVDDSLSKLEILDADINEIEDLTPFSTLSNLKMLSLRSNNVLSSSYFTNKKTLVLNSKNLLALDYHKSDIEKVEHNSGLENPDLLRIIKIDSYTNPDGSYNSDVDTFWEKLFGELFSRRQAKKRGLIRKNNPTISPIIQPIGEEIDPNDLKTSYEEFFEANKDEIDINITHEGLENVLIIDGFAKLKILDVGDNYLSYLVVRNCPELVELIYAHNSMKHDAFIDWATCRKLKPENVHKENYDGKLDRGYGSEPNKDNKESFNEKLKNIKKKKKQNEQVKKLLENIEKGETNSFAEFINHFQDQSFEFIFADLNEENQNQFRKIFVPQLNSHVQTLITNHSQMNKEQFIEKVKKIFPFKAYLTEELNQQLTNLLKTDLETKITNPPVTNNKSVWPIIFGSLAIILITLGIIFLLINRFVKKIKAN